MPNDSDNAILGRGGRFRNAVLKIAGIGILAFLFLAPFTQTQVAWATNATNTNTPASTSSAPRRTSLVNPLGRGVTLQTIIGRATRIFMGVAGSFALLMFVYGGFMWVTSGGNMDKVKKGKQIFTYAVIGLAVIYGSYIALQVIFRALEGTAF